MTPKSTPLLRILGFAALLFLVVGQALHATEILYSAGEQSECHHHEHSDPSSQDCPAEHSCCHFHHAGVTLADNAAALPEIPCRDFRFLQSADALPDGSLREIDYPPQLS
jgi:hypothetical protein